MAHNADELAQAFGIRKKEKKHHEYKWVKWASLAAAALILVLFGCFLLKQYSYAYLSHDDYGYATLSYVYWEQGMWGQDFSMEQLSDYLTQHYNRWGGRVLSFGQEILIMRQGEVFTKTTFALLLWGIFAFSFCLAMRGQNKKKALPVAILLCSVLGYFSIPMVTSGLYWYTATILYEVPVLYLLLGAFLVHLMTTDKLEHKFSVSKLLMLPFACVLFFFAGFSMEQVGAMTVAVAAILAVYGVIYQKNGYTLAYSLPPFFSAVFGCAIMLSAYGNNSRRSMYTDYYVKSFMGRFLTSAQQITDTVFRKENFLFVVLLAMLAIGAAYLIVRKSPKHWWLLALNTLLSVITFVIAWNNKKNTATMIYLWAYLFEMAVTVSVWLFGKKTKQAFLVWALFVGGLVSQGVFLVSPIYPDRSIISLAMALLPCLAALFFEAIPDASPVWWKKCGVILTVAVVAFVGYRGMYTVLKGFEENDRVQRYNQDRLIYTGYKFDTLGIEDETVSLMRLKDDTFAGSTQPYGRDLIKDWMKIFYKLPTNLTYEDFIYEPYDENRLIELENELKRERIEVSTNPENYT